MYEETTQNKEPLPAKETASLTNSVPDKWPFATARPLSLYEWAKLYLDLGWPIVPTKAGTKRPALSWKEFQQRRPAYSELAAWFRDKDVTRVGIGLVTGELSGVVVVDEDSYKGKISELQIDSPVKVRTGRGGTHHYFRFPAGAVRNSVNAEIAVDVRAAGGFVVLPPTLHPETGKAYEWIGGFDFDLCQKLPPLPLELLEQIMPKKKEMVIPHHSLPLPTKYSSLNINDYIGLREGGRNDGLYRVACSLLNKYQVDDALDTVHIINKTYYPPLPDSEVNSLFDSARRFIDTGRLQKAGV